MIWSAWFKVGDLAARLGNSFMELNEEDRERLVRFGLLSLLWMIVVAVATIIFCACLLLFMWTEALSKGYTRIWRPIRIPVRLLAGIAFAVLGGFYWITLFLVAVLDESQRMFGRRYLRPVRPS